MRVTLDDLPEAAVDYDPAANRWRVTLAGETRELAEWRWGPRKRLIAAAGRDGAVDPQGFAEGFGELCWEPAPAAAHARLWAWIGLVLAGLGPLLPAAEVEAAWAARTGLAPGALEEEPASAIVPIRAEPVAAAAPGWTVFQFADAGQ